MAEAMGVDVANGEWVKFDIANTDESIGEYVKLIDGTDKISDTVKICLREVI